MATAVFSPASGGQYSIGSAINSTLGCTSLIPGVAAASQCKYFHPSGVPLASTPSDSTILPASAWPYTLSSASATPAQSANLSSAQSVPGTWGDSSATPAPTGTVTQTADSSAVPDNSDWSITQYFTNAPCPSVHGCRTNPPLFLSHQNSIAGPSDANQPVTASSPVVTQSVLQQAQSVISTTGAAEPVPSTMSVADSIPSGMGETSVDSSEPPRRLLSTSEGDYILQGSNTVSPNGLATTVSNIEYSALPAGLGVEVVDGSVSSTLVVVESPTPVQLDGAGGYVVQGSISLSLSLSPYGPATTVSSIEYSALSAGLGVQVLDESVLTTLRVVESPTPVRFDGLGGYIVQGSISLSPDGPATTVSDIGYSALPASLGVHVSDEDILTTLRVVESPAPVRFNGFGGYIVHGSISLSPGGPATTVSDIKYSALPAGLGIQVVDEGKTSTLTAAETPVPGFPIEAVSGRPGMYSILGQTASAGGPAITVSGTEFTALPAASGVLIVQQGRSSTYLPPPHAPTAFPASTSGGYVLQNGQLITEGGQAVTISDAVYTALPSGGGVLVVVDGSSTTVDVASGSAGATGAEGAVQTSTSGSPEATDGVAQATGDGVRLVAGLAVALVVALLTVLVLVVS